jgi:methyl-accepting chemotaxis protein
MRRFSPSVQLHLIALFGIMATALIAICAVAMSSAWRQQETAQHRVEVGNITRHFFLAMQNMRVERGTVSAALLESGPVDPATWRDIQALRAKSAPALAEALNELSQLDFADRESWLEKLRAKSASLQSIRTNVDALLQTRPPGGNAEVNRQWVTAVGSLVDDLDAVSNRLSSEVRLNDPFFDQMMTVKQLAWSVRSDAGVERLVLGDAIASGAKVSDDWRRRVTDLQSRVGATWGALLNLVDDPKTPQPLLHAIAAAKEAYFNRYTHDRDEIYKSLIAGDHSQTTSRAWIQDTNAALEALIAVANTAVDLAQATAEEMSADARQHLIYQILLVLVALLISGLALNTIREKVIKPIVLLTSAMRELAAGNTRVEVPNVSRHDELGAMADAVRVFKQAAIENAQLRNEQDQMATKISEEKKATAEKLAKTFNAKIGNLVQVLQVAANEMEATARSMSKTAEQADLISTQATSFAEHTSANVRQIAVASGQLAGSALEIGSRASTSASLVEKAVQDTRRTDGAARLLSERSERIEQVVKLISDIAAQTNLLALNATIEAARAGEAGRGFGVVASEVKMLAAQTARATEEISSQVVQSQQAATDVVEAIRSVANTVQQLHSTASAIAAATDEQQAAAQEIARSTAEAARGTQEVTSNITQVRHAAADTGSASSQVLAASATLVHSSSELGREVELFLAGLAVA